MTVRFQFGEGERALAISFGRRAVMEVPGEIRRKLLAPPLFYRDRKVLSFAREKARRLTVTADGRTDSARYDGTPGGWALEGGGELDARRAEIILWTLSRLTTEEFVGEAGGEKGATELSKYGLDEPSVRTEVVVRPDARGGREAAYVLLVGGIERLELGEGEAALTRYYAKFEDDDTVFLLAGETVSRLRKGFRADETGE